MKGIGFPPSPKALEELSFSASPLQSLQREALPNKATGGCIIQQRDSLRYEKKAAAARGGGFFFFSSGIVGFARTGLFRAPGPWVYAPCGGGGAPPLFSQKLSAACEGRPCRVLLSARRHGVVLLPPQPHSPPPPNPPPTPSMALCQPSQDGRPVGSPGLVNLAR